MKSGHTTSPQRRRPLRALGTAGLTLGLALTGTATVQGAISPGGLASGELSGPPQGPDWVVLQLPAVDGGSPQTAALLDGRHLFEQGGGYAVATDLGPELPPRLAEDLATRAASSIAGASVQLLDGSLFVRGPAEAQVAARGRLEALEDELAGLRFEVNVRLTTGDAAAEPLIDSRRLVRSGGVAAFGRREDHAFVHGYRIEVASDIAIGAPEVGRALVGETVHLWASTAVNESGVRQLYIQGLLDVSRLTAIEKFDTEILALGEVEQPALESTQVMFAGIVPSSGPLRLTATGPDRATAQLILEIEAAPQRADAAGADVIDLARGLWRVRTRRPHVLAPEGPPALRPGTTPAGLAQLYSRQFSKRGTATLSSTETLLFSDPGSPERARLLRRLDDELDPISPPAKITVGWDGFTATVPTVEGALVRIARLRETTMVVGYEPQLANDAALCQPIIGHIITGTMMEAVVRGRQLVGTGHDHSVSTARVHAPGTGDSGRLELPVRSHSSFPLRLTADTVQKPGPGVTISWRSLPGDDR